jgi:hypothetical protein
MARSIATLPAGSRVTDYISLGRNRDVLSAEPGECAVGGDEPCEPAPA